MPKTTSQTAGTTTTTPPAATAQPATEATPYTPPATQADLDRIITERLARQRTQFADYDQLKAKAAKFDEAEQAAMTEAQRQAALIADLQAKVKAAEDREQNQTWRAQVSQDTGVPAHLLHGATLDEITASAAAIKAYTAQTPTPPGQLHDHALGRQPQLTPGSGDWVRDKFNR